MACSHVPTCPLFSLFTMNSSLKLWRINYCDSHFEKCERYKLSHAGGKVPKDMLPNGKTLAIPGKAAAAK